MTDGTLNVSNFIKKVSLNYCGNRKFYIQDYVFTNVLCGFVKTNDNFFDLMYN